MPKKYGTLVSDLLTVIGEVLHFEWPIEGTEAWRYKQMSLPKKKLYDNIWQMKNNGLVKIVKIKNKQFLKLTEKGQLETLLEKAKLQNKIKWDGKWRFVIFDIPEDFRDKRNQLRGLLKRGGFKKLQASVFVSPDALNREAVKFLKQTGLIRYIRIIKAEEMDDDGDLKKLFGLDSKPN